MPDRSIEELEELVGETYSVVERFPIERGKIAEFAEAIGFDDEMFTDTTADTARTLGFEDVPVPPTFTMASSFYRRRQDVDGRPDFGLDPERTVHAQQAFEIRRVPVAGDVLHARCEVTDVYQRTSSDGQQLSFVETTTTFFDEADEPVVDSIAVNVEFGATPESEGSNSE